MDYKKLAKSLLDELISIAGINEKYINKKAIQEEIANLLEKYNGDIKNDCLSGGIDSHGNLIANITDILSISLLTTLDKNYIVHKKLFMLCVTPVNRILLKIIKYNINYQYLPMFSKNISNRIIKFIL